MNLLFLKLLLLLSASVSVFCQLVSYFNASFYVLSLSIVCTAFYKVDHQKIWSWERRQHRQCHDQVRLASQRRLRAECPRRLVCWTSRLFGSNRRQHGSNGWHFRQTDNKFCECLQVLQEQQRQHACANVLQRQVSKQEAAHVLSHRCWSLLFRRFRHLRRIFKTERAGNEIPCRRRHLHEGRQKTEMLCADEDFRGDSRTKEVGERNGGQSDQDLISLFVAAANKNWKLILFKCATD